VKQIRRRLTYANVMSSIAVFLVLGGAAFAAAQLPKNSVGKKQLKNNAVTAAKIKKNAVTAAKIKKGAVDGSKVKDGSLSGADINLGSLGTVPSANTANTANSAKSADTAGTANSLAGRIPVSRFIGSGTQDLATVGPFTIRGDCTIDNGGNDEGAFELVTSQDGSAMDDNNGDEWVPFDVGTVAELYAESTTTGNADIEAAESPGLVAVAPDGTAIVFQNQSIGFNLTGHSGQCYFAGLVQKIG
jgi:hypothetical protein